MYNKTEREGGESQEFNSHIKDISNRKIKKEVDGY